MATFLSLTFMPTRLIAGASASSSMSSTKSAESAQAHALLSRLSAIKAMDKSKLTSAEKKNLRNEVRSTREQLKSIGDGIYLSLGAIIIIILLLILLL
jgi:hypothetical protein